MGTLPFQGLGILKQDMTEDHMIVHLRIPTSTILAQTRFSRARSEKQVWCWAAHRVTPCWAMSSFVACFWSCPIFCCVVTPHTPRFACLRCLVFCHSSSFLSHHIENCHTMSDLGCSHVVMSCQLLSVMSYHVSTWPAMRPFVWSFDMSVARCVARNTEQTISMLH